MALLAAPVSVNFNHGNGLLRRYKSRREESSFRYARSKASADRAIDLDRRLGTRVAVVSWNNESRFRRFLSPRNGLGRPPIEIKNRFVPWSLGDRVKVATRFYFFFFFPRDPTTWAHVRGEIVLTSDFQTHRESRYARQNFTAKQVT